VQHALQVDGRSANERRGDEGKMALHALQVDGRYAPP